MSHSILIIDDDETALLVRKMVLEDFSYIVTTATNTADALHAFATHDFDLVITDHLLLPHSKKTLAQELRRLSPNLPVLILSGGISLSADDCHPPEYFLHKLDGPKKMISKVRSAIRAVHV
ncbi:MAG TPA: response regulator [Terriglobales bacterium]|nr:response regulator [Terriglobales bacterium]